MIGIIHEVFNYEFGSFRVLTGVYIKNKSEFSGKP